jgi:hypothetical protein
VADYVDGVADRADHAAVCPLCAVREEGFQALFKGLWPNYLKVVPSIAIAFVTYEQVSPGASTVTALLCKSGCWPSTAVMLCYGCEGKTCPTVVNRLLVVSKTFTYAAGPVRADSRVV